MTKLQRNESIAFAGKIGAIVHTTQPDGRVFEQYRRPPGTRLIITSPDSKILITREHRQEANGVDLRLPGGKVFDTYEEYQALLARGESLEEAAIRGAIAEGREETGLIIKSPKLLTVAKAGSTVSWDLYYFLINDYELSPDGQQLGTGENIIVSWMSEEEIRQAIIHGQMNEWRSVGVLLGLVFSSN
jgi:ADP-ribose pyrophosphatase YjhB (NUDIX family)